MAGDDDDRRGGVLPLVVPSVVALVAVVAPIGALLGLFGQPVDDDVSARPTVTSTARSGSAAAGARTTGSERIDARLATDGPLPSPYPSSSSSAVSRSSAASPASRSGPYGGAAKERAHGTAARPLPVYVLNQTTRSGLAAQVAEDIESAGWSVTKVSWWRGTVPSTTVYYPVGHEAAAQALSDAFPAIDRVRPRVAPMPDDALTVILCKEYPQG